VRFPPPPPGPALACLPLIVAFALALAACGGEEEAPTEIDAPTATPEGAAPDGRGEGGEGPGGPAEGPPPAPTRGHVRAVIEAFVTSTNPAVVCGAVVTDDLLERAFGDRRGCREALAPEAVADRVEVRAIRVGEGGASAIAVPRGGVNDGLEVEVELVESNGALLIDRFEADVPPGP
jgi:hypothetical protein